MLIELYLPFPPSNNHYYVKTKRGIFISKKGRLFREAAAEAVQSQLGMGGGDFPITERMLIETVYFPPDRRIRDIANYSKALHDALTLAELWEDDSLIDQNFEYRGVVRPGSGSVFMRIQPAGPLIADPQSLP